MIRIALLCVALSLSFRTFQYFPNLGPVQEAWFVLVAVALVLIYLPWRLNHGGHSRGLEVYVVVLMALIPFWSAFAAQQEFGQPLLYGLLAQRGMVLVAGVPLLTYQALATRIITLKDLERALVFLAWSTLALYLAMTLLFDPVAYSQEYGLGFVSGSNSDYRFKFDTVFIVFGFFYYAFRGLRRRSLSDYLRGAAFLLFLLVVIQGRSLIVSLLAAFLWLSIRWTSKKSRLPILIFGIALTASLIGGGVFFFNHDLYETLLQNFSDSITIISTGQYTDNISANSRIDQSYLAMPYIEKHWLIGNGTISNQWNQGFSSVMGYFYPDDIGIIGVVYLYGIIGTLFLGIQFVFAYLFAKVRTTKNQDPLLDAATSLILFYGFRSIATGQFVHHPEALLLCIVVLWVSPISPATRRWGGANGHL